MAKDTKYKIVGVGFTDEKDSEGNWKPIPQGLVVIEPGKSSTDSESILDQGDVDFFAAIDNDRNTAEKTLNLMKVWKNWLAKQEEARRKIK